MEWKSDSETWMKEELGAQTGSGKVEQIRSLQLQRKRNLGLEAWVVKHTPFFSILRWDIFGIFLFFPHLLNYCVIFIFHCFNVIYHIIDLHMLKHPCIFRLNPNWSWCLILLIFCWMPFASILVEILHFVHQGYWPISFCVVC